MASILSQKTDPTENDHNLRGHLLTIGPFLHLKYGLRSLDPCSMLDSYFVQVQILVQCSNYTP